MTEDQSDNLRWHDQDPILRDLLEKVKNLTEKEQDQVMMELKYIINKHDDTLIGSHIEEYRLRRRWYDKNPYTWLVINALKYASPELIEQVKAFLTTRL